MKLLFASLSISSLLLTACTDQIDDDPELGETESASTPIGGQGSMYNGSMYNGSMYNGSMYNGSMYNGSMYNGSSYGGSTLPDAATIYQTAITIWRPIWVATGGKTNHTIELRWEKRSPAQICTYNSDKSSLIGCTTVNPATSPSPLTGVGFPATFFNPTTQATITGTVYIGGTSTTAPGAVSSDTTTMALHPLYGAATTHITTYPNVDANGNRCDNPAGCASNSDLWLYQVKLWDPQTQTQYDLCPNGAKAFALSGTYDGTGKWTGDPSQFTFACTTGTIAKCTRWGYRHWASAYKSDWSWGPLADYHQACVRAATADYCANGHSFTLNGTLVDVYDYEPQQAGYPGYIPRQVSVEYVQQHPTPNAFVWESQFDSEGATELDFVRYMELASNPAYGSVESYCPGRFSLPTAPDPDDYHRPYTRQSPDPAGTARVSIDNTVVCSHSEQTVGKWLHPTCSACTDKLWREFGLEYSCISPTGSWTGTCAKVAKDRCSTSEMLASHGECVVSSTPLHRFDSACTIKVCNANAACCSGSWSQSCVNTANAQCTGGRENNFGTIGFCGTTILVGNG